MLKFTQALVVIMPTIIYFVIRESRKILQPWLALLFVLISAAIYLFHSRCAKPRLKRLMTAHNAGLAVLAIFLTLATNFPIGGYLSQPLMLKHSSENAQAIVVFASGSNLVGEPNFSGYQRVMHGINLLGENRAPVLFLSTGYSSLIGHAEAAWVASLTAKVNIERSSYEIIADKNITTTATEAAHFAKILKDRGISRILVVTSGAHIYRTCATFKKLGFEVLPAPAHNKESIFYSSGHYLLSLEAAIHEWVGLVYYRLRGYI